MRVGQVDLDDFACTLSNTSHGGGRCPLCSPKEGHSSNGPCHPLISSQVSSRCSVLIIASPQVEYQEHPRALPLAAYATLAPCDGRILVTVNSRQDEPEESTSSRRFERRGTGR